MRWSKAFLELKAVNPCKYYDFWYQKENKHEICFGFRIHKDIANGADKYFWISKKEVELATDVDGRILLRRLVRDYQCNQWEGYYTTL